LPEVPANTVIQVIQAGYMIGERVLRPAAVVLASGKAANQHSNVYAGEHTVSAQQALKPRPRTLAILHKPVMSGSEGVPAAKHPIWERLVTGQIKHTFKLFAANMLVDRAKREYAIDGGAKPRLASELYTFFSRNKNLTAVDLEPILRGTGRIPAASDPIWGQLVTGQIKHTFRLFAANMLVDRAKREYAADRGAKPRLASELCDFFNGHADLTAAEIRMVASRQQWLNY
jgi:hypothetical protein